MPRKETLSLLAVDLLLVTFGWWLAFWLRFNLDVPPEFSDLAWRSGPWVLLSLGWGCRVLGFTARSGATSGCPNCASWA